MEDLRTIEQQEYDLIQFIRKEKDLLWEKQRVPRTLYAGRHYFFVIASSSSYTLLDQKYLGLKVLEVLEDTYHCKVSD